MLLDLDSAPWFNTFVSTSVGVTSHQRCACMQIARDLSPICMLAHYSGVINEKYGAAGPGALLRGLA